MYGSAEPDWIALADRHERETRRRKRIRAIVAAAAATAVVGGITATAVLVSGSAARPTDRTATVIDGVGPRSPSAASTGSPGTGSSASASGSASPAPSATAGQSASPRPASSGPVAQPAPPAPPVPAPSTAAPKDPLTLISDVHTDTAPLDPATLFAADTLQANGATWTKLEVKAASPCWKETTGGLGDVIANGCGSLLLATYTNGYSSVTIGVAVFDTKSLADQAQAAYKGQIQGVAPAGTIAFCTSAGCANTHGAIGRYDYYSVSGTRKPGRPSDALADPVATAAGPVLADYARTRLLARGQAAAAG